MGLCQMPLPVLEGVHTGACISHVGCELPQQHTSTDNGFDNMPPVTLGLFLAALYMKLPPTIQSKKGSKPVNHLAHEASRGKKAYLKDGQKA